MIEVPQKLLHRTKLQGQRVMIPIITRNEFKVTSRPKRAGSQEDEKGFNPVLKGYVSRQRDELVAHKNRVDYTGGLDGIRSEL